MTKTTRQLIETRLQDVIGKHVTEIKGAASLKEIKNSRFKHGGLYIYPLRRSAGRSTSDAFVTQRVQEQFGVVAVARNVRDARGGDSTDEIETLNQHVKTALLGWCITPEFEQMTYATGGLVGFIEQHVLWQEVYATANYWRANAC